MNKQEQSIIKSVLARVRVIENLMLNDFSEVMNKEVHILDGDYKAKPSDSLFYLLNLIKRDISFLGLSLNADSEVKNE